VFVSGLSARGEIARREIDKEGLGLAQARGEKEDARDGAHVERDRAANGQRSPRLHQ
jgi:hypothetical protein